MGKKYKSYRRINDKDFNAIKTLQKLGLSVTKAHQATGRAFATVQRIYESDTLEEYRQSLPSRNKESVKPEVEQPRPETSDAIVLLKQNLVLQERQAEALETMAAILSNKPVKKRLF